ncbi:hypothetical protein V1511DRAFT_505856 [Dipodascopsis uninucleata]
MSGTTEKLFDPNKYIPVIEAILRVADLEKISAKRIRYGIQEIFEIDLAPFKKSIDSVILECFNNIQEELAQSVDSGTPKKRSVSESRSVIKRESNASLNGKIVGAKVTDAEYAAQLHKELNSVRKTRTAPHKRRVEESGKRSEPKKKKRAVNENNPFNARMFLSSQLSEFLEESELSRPEAVKRIWAYIKSNSLQNPNDKREILCDARMRPIFGEKTHMFTMNKILAKHLFRKDEVTSGSGSLQSRSIPNDRSVDGQPNNVITETIAESGMSDYDRNDIDEADGEEDLVEYRQEIEEGTPEDLISEEE